MDKSEIILSAETQFAREVTLGVIYHLPLPIWYSLIPGMFLFDFIRRNRAINNFTKWYMFPRHLALSAAVAYSDGKNPSAIHEQMKNGIEHELKSRNLSYHDLIIAQRKGIELLSEHYRKLISADGTCYNDLIENAYKTRKAFQSHLSKLEKAENKIDRAMMDRGNQNDTFKKRMTIEAQQVKLRRNKLLDDIF